MYCSKKFSSLIFTKSKNNRINIMKDKELKIKYKSQLNLFLIKMYKISIDETEKKTYIEGADLVKNASPKIIGNKIKNFFLSVFNAIIKQ